MKKKNSINFAQWLQSVLIRTCRIHFWLIGALALYTIASDATGLITPQATLKRWYVVVGLGLATTLVWYLSRANKNDANYYRFLTYGLIITDVLVATYSVYAQRGMASKAVLLYAVAIATSAILLSRVALLTTASIAAGAYTLAVVKYFVDFFNEGFKAELYIETGFYIAVFFAIASLLGVVIRFHKPETEIGL